MPVDCPKELRKRYKEGRVIPFIGAGVSMSVKWKQGDIVRRGPSWKELVDESARLMGFEDPELLRYRGTDLQILEYFKIKNDGETAKLTNWLVQNMLPSDDDLRDSQIHRALAELEHCRLVYTTNYDDFIERAMKLHGRACKTVAAETEMGSHNIGTGDCEVVKFHGDLNHPRKMVLSESDYEKRLRLDSPMDHRLRADILGRFVLFLGYSFRDKNVSYLFRLVTDQLGVPQSMGGKRAYIAVPDPSDFEIQLFQARKIDVVEIDGEKKTEDIANLLRQLGR